MGTHSKMLLSCLILGLAAPSFSFPADCPMMEPSTCASSEVRCDSGMDSNGCWMGDICLPEGNICPHPCYPTKPSTCLENEVRCDRGMDGACWRGDDCMPEGSVCPFACMIPEPMMCPETYISCDNG